MDWGVVASVRSLSSQFGGERLVLDKHHHRVVLWRLWDGGGCRVVYGGGVASKSTIRVV